ncbi:WD40 repeat-like protein [Phanerochaete sordida]|uniref:WD40 repeat-like protein n=1 Tax=Phanerochaete sordida TaxID=48140 RepID=A0A9P3G0H7_9APHY|nr:WD40 repeat-like protein [Phanerochaete sordida]
MTATQPFVITADEVNCLIHAYFQDSGFVHSAFVLRAEGHLEKSEHFGQHVPRGELVELLSKALLYSEAEAHWKGNAMTNNCKAPFTILNRHVCSLDPSLPPTVTFQPPLPPPDTVHPVTNGTAEKRKASTSPAPEEVPKEKRARTEEMEVDSMTTSTEQRPADSRAQSLPETVDNPVPSTSKVEVETHLVPPDDIAVGMLKGHNSEVFVCAWNPANKNILGTGSKDTVMNIWHLHEPSPNEPTPTSESPLTFVHRVDVEQGDLTSLDWSPDGKLLAAGSYDTYLRICDSSGQLYLAESMQKKGPVFATRFSPSGQYLLTASIDGSVCAWDIPKKALYKQYRHHERCCLDVEWLSDDVFVSCGVDSNIHVVKLDTDAPLETLSIHSDEVNQIKCNPQRTLLASCSDDGTARIWDVGDVKLGRASSKKPVTLSGHTSTVSSIAWCPEDQTADYEILATSSLDGTARLWNSSTGECLTVFNDHMASIYTISFSPDARLFATAGADGHLHIYDVKSREVKWSWRASGERIAIFEIDWQQSGDLNRIALGLESGLVGVVDVAQIPALRIRQ